MGTYLRSQDIGRAYGKARQLGVFVESGDLRTDWAPWISGWIVLRTSWNVLRRLAAVISMATIAAPVNASAAARSRVG